jgi:hypothetical protein
MKVNNYRDSWVNAFKEIESILDEKGIIYITTYPSTEDKWDSHNEIVYSRMMTQSILNKGEVEKFKEELNICSLLEEYQKPINVTLGADLVYITLSSQVQKNEGKEFKIPYYAACVAFTLPDSVFTKTFLVTEVSYFLEFVKLHLK